MVGGGSLPGKQQSKEQDLRKATGLGFCFSNFGPLLFYPKIDVYSLFFLRKCPNQCFCCCFYCGNIINVKSITHSLQFQYRQICAYSCLKSKINKIGLLVSGFFLGGWWQTLKKECILTLTLPFIIFFKKISQVGLSLRSTFGSPSKWRTHSLWSFLANVLSDKKIGGKYILLFYGVHVKKWKKGRKPVQRCKVGMNVPSKKKLLLFASFKNL